MLLCLKQQLKLLMFLQGTQTLHCFVVLYVTNYSLLSGFCQKLSSRCIITNTTCTQLYSLSSSSQSIMIICVQIFCGSGETTKYYFNNKSGIAVYTYIQLCKCMCLNSTCVFLYTCILVHLNVFVVIMDTGFGYQLLLRKQELYWVDSPT